MQIWVGSETVWVYEEVKTNPPGGTPVLSDPTTILLTITDPTGTVKVDGLSMTKYNSEDGKFEYFYSLPASPEDGDWEVKVVIVDGTGGTAKTTISKGTFRVR